LQDVCILNYVEDFAARLNLHNSVAIGMMVEIAGFSIFGGHKPCKMFIPFDLNGEGEMEITGGLSWRFKPQEGKI